MDLFDYSNMESKKSKEPLAERLRPKSLSEFIGQEDIVGSEKLLYKAIKADKLSSIIFHGPPGTGKTTLAKVISKETSLYFEQLNAVTSGVKDIREMVSLALERKARDNKKTILFIDEIHRFNKSQQDALLPYVENGTIILIGATTENPYYEVNKALISRAMIFELKPLSDSDIKKIIKRALEDSSFGYGDMEIEIEEKAVDHLAMVSNGDARIALNALELAVLTSKMDEEGRLNITLDIIQESVQRKVIKYEKSGDEHYDNISAFIKSIRGSDPDAAVYWLGKMLYGGEDPKFIGRRLIISASEDIGNADPNALTVAVSAFSGLNVVGMPEARIILSQATIYLASAPKSDSAYAAINAVNRDLESKRIYSVPSHIGDRAENYLCPHDYENNYVKQNYLPEELKGTKYYKPSSNGYEKQIREHLSKLKGE
jgi:putative ATPase